MPSMIVAAGLMALSGMATAFPQASTYSNGTATNATAPATNGTSSAVTESLFCPNLSGSVIRSKTGTSEFLLACNTNYFGVVIDVQFNSTLFINKRQAAVAPSNIQDCLSACDAVTGCVGTAFDVAAQTCALYAELGAAYTDNGIDFAIRVATGDAVTTVPAGGVATSTVYSTNVVTVSSCAPTVTNCPLNSLGGAVTATEVVAVSSTQYVCPTAVVVPMKPVACACAYGASTATVYTVSGTTVVPVETKVVAVPSPSGTAISTTTVQGTGAAVTTAALTAGATAGASTAGAVGGSKTTTSGMATFTGGASNVQAAGAGMAGLIAAAAFML